MRTKLILALTAATVSALQLASAQGVSSGIQNEIAPAANQPDNYVEVVTTSDATPVTAADFTSSSFASDNSAIFVSRENSEAAAVATLSLSFTDSTTDPAYSWTDSQSSTASVVPAVEKFAAKRNSEASANWAADGSWLNVVPAAQTSFASAYFSSSSSASVDLSLPSKNMDTAAIGALAAASGAAPSGGAPKPLLLTPEPGTVGLMIFGGSALLGALRRRK